MTDRWSNPSGGIGVHRFRVWPSGSDSYDHVENAANWDQNDAILGQPSSAAQWPPTTGLDGGIYKEIRLLQLDRPAIGEVFAWFRPTLAVPIPAGCVPCDGSVVLAADHDFAGVASDVTLPDLRNSFVLGADAGKTLGAPADAVGSGNLDTNLGAPGPNATGGSHKIVQILAQLAAHAHNTVDPGHGHGIADPGHSHVLIDPGHTHGVTDPGHTHGPSTIVNRGGGIDSFVFGVGGPDFTLFNSLPDAATTDISINSHGTGIALGVASTNVTAFASTTNVTVSSAGSGSPMDNRPRYVGLIYLCRVRYADTI